MRVSTQSAGGTGEISFQSYWETQMSHHFQRLNASLHVLLACFWVVHVGQETARTTSDLTWETWPFMTSYGVTSEPNQLP